MKKPNIKKTVKQYLLITVGAAIYAAGISLFLDPNNLAPGGVTGIAIIVNYLTKLPTGTLVLCMNIPLMIIGVWKFGLRFFFSTIYATLLSSALINVFLRWGPLTEELILAGAAGGAMMAFGMALVFKGGATTGGTDIIVRIIKLKFKHVRTGKLFLITDAFVILAAAIVFKDIDIALYAAVSTVVSSIVFDIALYGSDSARLTYIITDKEEQIAARLLDLDLGVTYLHGTGAYTNDSRRVIMCAVRKQLLPQVQDIAMEEDPFVFLIVTSANEIFGEGFKNIDSERL